MDVQAQDKGVLGFGPFRIDDARRHLMCNGVRIKISSRLFDTLSYFAANAGRVIEKDELMQAVWGGRIVEDANLSQTIFAVRKVLRDEGGIDEAIVTAPGRGYRFVLPVRREAAGPPPVSVAAVTQAVAAPDAPAILHQAMAGSAWAGAAARRRLPIMGVLALAAAAAWALTVPLRGPAAPVEAPFAPPPHSVAVLAFANMTGDAGRDYFSDGIADELINALSRIDGLHVAARTSAFSFKGKNATIRDIARLLNVSAVLEGSVLRDGKGLRINAELVDARSGFQFWARTYDNDGGSTDGILQARAAIAAQVAASLEVQLLGGNGAKLALGETHDDRALDAYLRGMADAQALDDAHARQAIAAYTHAIDIDPGYAAAYAGRALVFNFLVTSGSGSDVATDKANLAAALSDADRAIALAPALAASHRVRAIIGMTAWDFSASLREIGEARELAPDSAAVLASYGQIEGNLGHAAESLGALQHAISLDPLNAVVFRRLATELYYAGRYDDALSMYRHADEIDPHMSRVKLDMVANVYLAKRDYSAAQHICEGGDSFFDRNCLAIAYHGLGRQPEAEADLAKLQAELGDRAAALYAGIYAAWGEPDRAMDWLRTAFRLHDSGLDELKVEHIYDPLRGLPAFQQIMRQMNFPT